MKKILTILFFLPLMSKAQFELPTDFVYQFLNGLELSEMSAPTTPSSGFGYLYEKINGKPYFKNDAGTEYDLVGVTTEVDPVWLSDKPSYLTSATAASTYVSLSGSYANPSWITSLAWSKITGTPTTIAGYGITDAPNLQKVLSSGSTLESTHTIDGMGVDLNLNINGGDLNVSNAVYIRTSLGGEKFFQAAGGDVYLGQESAAFMHVNENFFKYIDASNVEYFNLNKGDEQFHVSFDHGGVHGKFIFVNALVDDIMLGDVEDLNNGTKIDINDRDDFESITLQAENLFLKSAGYATATNGDVPVLTDNSTGQVQFQTLTSSSISDFTEASQDAVLPTFYNVVFDLDDPSDFISIRDRDFGDITTSSDGSLWVIDDGVVSNAKLANSAITVDGVSTSLGGSVTTFGFTITIIGLQGTITDGQTYYSGALSNGTGTTADVNRIYIPVNCTLKAVYGWCFNNTPSSGTETSTLYIRKNNTTDLTIANNTFLHNATATTFNATGLSTTYVAGDYIEGKELMPTFAGTNPANCRWTWTLYFEKI